MNAYTIDTDGTMTEVIPNNGTDFQLEELYQLIDCQSILMVDTTNDDLVMVIDEEGNIKDEVKINHKATSQYQYASHHSIVGKVLICKRKMIK